MKDSRTVHIRYENGGGLPPATVSLNGPGANYGFDEAFNRLEKDDEGLVESPIQPAYAKIYQGDTTIIIPWFRVLEIECEPTKER